VVPSMQIRLQWARSGSSPSQLSDSIAGLDALWHHPQDRIVGVRAWPSATPPSDSLHIWQVWVPLDFWHRCFIPKRSPFAYEIAELHGAQPVLPPNPLRICRILKTIAPSPSCPPSLLPSPTILTTFSSPLTVLPTFSHCRRMG